MAYQTGTAANPDQLLDALRVFAIVQGWSPLRWASDGNGQTLSLSKGALFVHLCSAHDARLSSRYNAVTGIWLTGATGFAHDQPWWNQPGGIHHAGYAHNATSERAEACGLFGVGSATTYHLFAATEPDLLMLVAEVAPGIYHHLAFGQLAMFGKTGGGAFVSGAFGSDDHLYLYSGTGDALFSYAYDHHAGLPFNDYKAYGSANGVLAEVDGALQWYSVCSSDPVTGKRAKSLWENGPNASSISWGRCWHSHVPNTLNGVTPMLPFTVFVERPSGFFSPFGYTPHLRYLNITHYAPAERFSLGHESWMAFPAHSKNGNSGVHGVAVRWIV